MEQDQFAWSEMIVRQRRELPATASAERRARWGASRYYAESYLSVNGRKMPETLAPSRGVRQLSAFGSGETEDAAIAACEASKDRWLAEAQGLLARWEARGTDLRRLRPSAEEPPLTKGQAQWEAMLSGAL